MVAVRFAFLVHLHSSRNGSWRTGWDFVCGTVILRAHGYIMYSVVPDIMAAALWYLFWGTCGISLMYSVSSHLFWTHMYAHAAYTHTVFYLWCVQSEVICLAVFVSWTYTHTCTCSIHAHSFLSLMHSLWSPVLFQRFPSFVYSVWSHPFCSVCFLSTHMLMQHSTLLP